MNNFKKTCGICKNSVKDEDLGLHCSLSNNLCYEDTLGCTNYEPNTNKLIKTIENLQSLLNKAISDISQALKTNDICSFCAYKIKCPGNNSCSEYIEGVGVKDEQGKTYNWKWDCTNFEYGTCDKLIGTPCENCDLTNHFKWRGLK